MCHLFLILCIRLSVDDNPSDKSDHFYLCTVEHTGLAFFKLTTCFNFKFYTKFPIKTAQKLRLQNQETITTCYLPVCLVPFRNKNLNFVGYCRSCGSYCLIVLATWGRVYLEQFISSIVRKSKQCEF